MNTFEEEIFNRKVVDCYPKKQTNSKLFTVTVFTETDLHVLAFFSTKDE